MPFRSVCICVFVACASAACSNSLSPTSATASTTSTTTPTTILVGSVIDEQTRAGIASATLTLVDSSGNVQTTTTSATGAFQFSSLATGTCSLQVTAPGYITSVATLSLPVASYTARMSMTGSA